MIRKVSCVILLFINVVKFYNYRKWYLLGNRHILFEEKKIRLNYSNEVANI